jgi:hypothetical protein
MQNSFAPEVGHILGVLVEAEALRLQFTDPCIQCLVLEIDNGAVADRAVFERQRKRGVAIRALKSRVMPGINDLREPQLPLESRGFLHIMDGQGHLVQVH